MNVYHNRITVQNKPFLVNSEWYAQIFERLAQPSFDRSDTAQNIRYSQNGEYCIFLVFLLRNYKLSLVIYL